MLGDLRRTNWWLLVGVVLVITAYIGSYATLVKRTYGKNVTLLEDAPVVHLVTIPVYRYGGAISKWLFMPIHQLDRRTRKEIWREAGPPKRRATQ